MPFFIFPSLFSGWPVSSLHSLQTDVYEKIIPTSILMVSNCFSRLGSTGIPREILNLEGIFLIDALTCDIKISCQAALGFSETFFLLVMAIDCFNNVLNPQVNNNRGKSVIRCSLIITASSVMGTLYVLIFKNEYDVTESNCYILKKRYWVTCLDKVFRRLL